MKPPSIPALIITLIWASFARGDADLQVERVLWGFTDTIVEHAAQPVSVLLHNAGDEEYRGAVSFYASELTQQVGLAETTPPFRLGPDRRRWVQFTAQLTSMRVYQLEVGLLDRRELGMPRPDDPQPIRLADESDPFRAHASVPRFPVHLFPRGVGALGGLRDLVIDSNVELDSNQQLALRDWVWLGGTLHLVGESEQGYPRLPGVAADLSPGGRAPITRSSTSFGVGRIVLHDFTRHQLERSRLGEGQTETHPFGVQRIRDSESFGELVSITQPHHRWGWIYLLSGMLFLVIGPINYLVAKRVRNYGVAVLVTVATVVVFSGIFFWLGKAGQRGLTGTYAFSYARQLEDGYYVQQHAHLFATRAQRYPLRPQADHAYFHVPVTSGRKIDGLSRNGVGGEAFVEIPLYSSRQIAGSYRFRSRPIVTVDPTRDELRLTLPDDASFVWGYQLEFGGNEQDAVNFRGTGAAAYRLVCDADGILTARRGSSSIDPPNRHFRDEERGSPDHRRFVFDRLAKWTLQKVIERERPPSNESQPSHLVLLVREPERFTLETGLPTAENYVLYHHVLTEPR